jgi:hypothetical protein
MRPTTIVQLLTKKRSMFLTVTLDIMNVPQVPLQNLMIDGLLRQAPPVANRDEFVFSEASGDVASR